MQYFVFYVLFLTLVPQVILGFITYSWEELLNIRATSTHHHYNQEYDFPEADPVFCLPPSTMDLIPAGDPKQRRRKRGKRSGLLVRLRRRAHRAPLPSILLANVQSFDNKVDEIRARVTFQRDIRDCNVLCFTETWLTRETLTESVQPAGFFTHRANRNKHLSGKKRGGGVCLMINETWCDHNNIQELKSFCSPDLEFLTLNVNKTKEMIVDFRKKQREHPPIHIDGTVVEKVESFKFLGVHITDKLNWSTHTDSVVKKAQQRLFNLRRLKKFGLSPKALTNFYRCTIESILSGCITAWYGNCSAHNRKALQRVVRSAQRITGGKLPALQDTYTTRCHRKAIKIIKDNNHPSHCLFTPLSSRRRGQYRCIKAGTERLKNSFYLKAIRLLNSHH
ncbi:carboxypeptidase N catalytic chain isoform X2 [Salvelinus fontinalis]|uniref:carboxypeptidase N catalytic chain isoform X2 n=1 Tax=Salvelinus fontinalis TaxID=8038 RepID=UPI002484FC09|nr:carboxypeptidase N catalytic chain isoform X2 [Salvelinus fontinalis]